MGEAAVVGRSRGMREVGETEWVALGTDTRAKREDDTDAEDVTAAMLCRLPTLEAEEEEADGTSGGKTTAIDLVARTFATANAAVTRTSSKDRSNAVVSCCCAVSAHVKAWCQASRLGSWPTHAQTHTRRHTRADTHGQTHTGRHTRADTHGQQVWFTGKEGTRACVRVPIEEKTTNKRKKKKSKMQK
jgi:hypothetical protein